MIIWAKDHKFTYLNFDISIKNETIHLMSNFNSEVLCRDTKFWSQLTNISSNPILNIKQCCQISWYITDDWETYAWSNIAVSGLRISVLKKTSVTILSTSQRQRCKKYYFYISDWFVYITVICMYILFTTN